MAKTFQTGVAIPGVAMPLHIGAGLLETLDREVGNAIRVVEDDEAGKVTVSLAFDVMKDENGDVVVGYTQKAGTARKGSWEPGSSRQGKLPFLRKAAEEINAGALGPDVTARAS